jgi:hypothetical protein
MVFTASSAAVPPLAGSYFRSVSRTTVAMSCAPNDHATTRPAGVHGCTQPFCLPGFQVKD